MAHPQAQPVSGKKDITTLASGASVTLIGRVAGRATHVLGQIVLARTLGPEAFGLYAIAWTMLLMGSLITPLGLDKGVIRYASGARDTDPARLKGVITQSLGFALLFGLGTGLVLYLGAPWFAEQVFHKPSLTVVIRWFAPAFVLASGLKVAAAATRVSRRMRYTVLTEDLLQPATYLLLILLFSLMGWGLLGAVAAGVGSYGIAAALAIYYVGYLFPEVYTPTVRPTFVARELLAFSVTAAFAEVFTMFIVWVDRLLVGYYRTAAEVGIYQAVSQSSILFGVVLSAFNTIFSPMIADLHHKGETGRLGEIFKVSTKWGFYLSLPLFLIMCFVPREIMIAVFGTQYEAGALPLVILAIGQLVNAGSGAVGLLLVMTGHQKRWFAISTMMLVVNITLNSLLTPRLGLPGAALSTAVSVGGLYTIGLLAVRLSLGIWPYDTRYLKGLLATAVTAGVLLLSNQFNVTLSALGSVVAAGLISSGTFAAVLLLLGLEPEDRMFIDLIKARIGIGNQRGHPGDA